MAHVRHRQGLRLARRPGCDRIHVPPRAGRGLRTGPLGRAVLPHRGGQDLSAPVRRHDDRLRQGRRAAHLRRRRPHRARHPAHALRPGAEGEVPVLHRVFRHRSHPRRRGRSARRRLPQAGRRDDSPVPRPDHRPRHRRLRPRLFLGHFGPHLHRRRQRDGAARRPAAAGHGVRAVPSDRHLRRRLPHHRGRARRGRLSRQFRGRALHGALRAARQGPRLARRRQPRDDDRDSRRPRRRQEQGPYLPAPRPSRSEGAARAAAGHFRERAHLRRRRRDQGADPRPADRPLQYGRHPDELSRRGPDQGQRRSRTRSCRD